MLFVRALVAFLALPAIVAGVVPLALLRGDRWRFEGVSLGWLILTPGLLVLVWCVRDFYAVGKGTLAPWDPPKKLVIAGLYRLMRNPMYVGVLGVVSGWSLLAGSPVLVSYAGLLALIFHLRIVYYEEPTLARNFTSEWTRYSANVSRWVPKLPGAKPR